MSLKDTSPFRTAISHWLEAGPDYRHNRDRLVVRGSYLSNAAATHFYNLNRFNRSNFFDGPDRPRFADAGEKDVSV
jgi:hypothetical protein